MVYCERDNYCRHTRRAFWRALGREVKVANKCLRRILEVNNLVCDPEESANSLIVGR